MDAHHQHQRREQQAAKAARAFQASSSTGQEDNGRFERLQSSFLAKVAATEASIKAVDAAIRDPSDRQLDPTAPLAFVVWTCCWDDDAPTSHGPRKTFNSSFETAADANDRVRAVFYEGNPWAMAVEEAILSFQVTQVMDSGFLHLETYFHARWSVAAEPMVTFASSNVPPQHHLYTADY
ncbi:Aste57867_12368 [Aphanomyces stellatus]|uniref:Aste57867_12368 protein n=1 Tax=Aphanomyces stellatus TaxID=120398 RepID=A0A485KVD6_9STRA|nr:hypothetical protein As57867_012322 [Aphanomyces stellatus]VFT89220.1 Aste57867_12368 [Aphanomyces stellatus]